MSLFSMGFKFVAKDFMLGSHRGRYTTHQLGRSAHVRALYRSVIRHRLC